ncbi:MAG TPA: STAS domain-containing protein [Armatimonadota bacterium]|jgi:anti-sigma B factor antagonist|nr:STAS domain-containing protein [Armatimonadota bacterium]HOJ20404.1 STAS domain-containing protein [Armatimonadota bacterium]HOM80575.1 STAS domain-containing protein [Armatimonadota bacterium]HOQ30374.1 STAS domain-containing protein [Armatimonadota bacterium]HPO72558.1 STAS domain-containing protein [Armatimonadota bacterium]
MNLTIDISRVDNATILTLAGELDAYTSLELRETVVRLVEEGVRSLIVNLSKVDFIDSVGLGTLVGCLKRSAEHGGTMRLVGLNPQIQKVFDITGLSKIFDIHTTNEEALKHVTPAAAGNS